MSFTTKPVGKYVEFLHFMKTNDIPFITNDPLELAGALYEDIKNPLLTPALLESLGLSYILEYIPINAQTTEFIELADSMKVLPPGDVLRRCNGAFKQFCGSENLTSDGQISRDAAMDMIYRYEVNHKLGSIDGWYHLDESLRSALNTDLLCVSAHDVMRLVEAGFR